MILKEKTASIVNSIGILKARRQALIREFLSVTMPVLKSREEIRCIYGKALREIAIAFGREGRAGMESISSAASRDFKIDIAEKSVWGLYYKDISFRDTPLRRPDERGYDWLSTTPHVEEACRLFEKILESMLGIAAFESKLKRLGDEILMSTRRIRALEERILPGLRFQINAISNYIAERERESYYRLKRFKQGRVEAP